MKTKTKKIDIQTEKQLEFIDITSMVEEVLESAGASCGTVTIFSPHTTGSIVVNHNEPMLLQDMTRILYKLVPIDERYSHDMFELTKHNKSDGRSNGHSHCKNMILGASESIPFQNGQMLLGEKQSVFFVELDGGRKRDFIVQVVGD